MLLFATLCGWRGAPLQLQPAPCAHAVCPFIIFFRAVSACIHVRLLLDCWPVPCVSSVLILDTGNPSDPWSADWPTLSWFLSSVDLGPWFPDVPSSAPLVEPGELRASLLVCLSACVSADVHAVWSRKR